MPADVVARLGERRDDGRSDIEQVIGDAGVAKALVRLPAGVSSLLHDFFIASSSLRSTTILDCA
jgi:hypothetical protein